jgi:hypothetical protein
MALPRAERPVRKTEEMKGGKGRHGKGTKATQKKTEPTTGV